jgi:hypothetical protein
MRVFRFWFGLVFIIFGIIVSLMRLEWGYGVLISSIVCEIVSYIGDKHVELHPYTPESRPKFRIHHAYIGILFIIASCFLLSWRYWELFFGFSVAFFLHDALFHFIRLFVRVDSNFQRNFGEK